MIRPVILCGGDGTRLWPASRRGLPKQFMPLHDSTLFKDTLERARLLAPEAEPLVLCNQEHRFLAASQMQEVGCSSGPAGATILLEPCGRNTAPAVAAAALLTEAEDPLLLILPSDHRLDPTPLQTALASSLPAARSGCIITFGIIPNAPETGYGYIKRGEPLNREIFRVERFVEKPDTLMAQGFIDSGDYFWNSGMFLASASTLIQEFEVHAPDILQACRAALESKRSDLDFIRLGEEAFVACRSESLDYAIMEHTARSAVVPLPAAWSDLGSWDSLYAVEAKDAAGNALVGDVAVEDCADSLVLAQSRLVAAVGLRDMVLVETPDAVLAAPRARAQEVKKIAAALLKAGRKEPLEHAKVYRPWGSFEGVALSERFQVKRIVVAPGKRLSLQKHHHRAEHWVVVRGTAKVTVGDATQLIHEDQSTYISIGQVHRLENPGKIPLELIEIQTGSYLGEDDIVRLDDLYGRVECGEEPQP